MYELIYTAFKPRFQLLMVVVLENVVNDPYDIKMFFFGNK